MDADLEGFVFKLVNRYLLRSVGTRALVVGHANLGAPVSCSLAKASPLRDGIWQLIYPSRTTRSGNGRNYKSVKIHHPLHRCVQEQPVNAFCSGSGEQASQTGFLCALWRCFLRHVLHPQRPDAVRLLPSFLRKGFELPSAAAALFAAGAVASVPGGAAAAAASSTAATSDAADADDAIQGASASRLQFSICADTLLADLSVEAAVSTGWSVLRAYRFSVITVNECTAFLPDRDK